MSIYSLIPKDRWISREELVRLSGMSDRNVRSEINQLRKRPETLIISSSSHKGYKRPATYDEVLLCLNESRSRVKEELEKQSVLEEAISSRVWEERTEQMYFDFGGSI